MFILHHIILDTFLSLFLVPSLSILCHYTENRDKLHVYFELIFSNVFWSSLVLAELTLNCHGMPGPNFRNMVGHRYAQSISDMVARGSKINLGLGTISVVATPNTGLCVSFVNYQENNDFILKVKRLPKLLPAI